MRLYKAKTILTKPQPAYWVLNIFSQQDVFSPRSLGFYEGAQEFRGERLAGDMKTSFFYGLHSCTRVSKALIK